MTAYYSEIEPYAAQWLRNLIAAGHIASGDVDERSIEDVSPDDLRGYTQCHFFAGIGIWSHALRRAGWDDDRPVWTGSCPCQPFSAAGKGAGFADERHLWPAWFHLIGECRPATILGEQVSSKDGLAWLDLVHTDMEAAGYAFGPLDLCAAGVGAPHLRQRLYFMAHHHHSRLEGRWLDGVGRLSELAAGPRGVAGLVALPDNPVGRSDTPGGHDADGDHAGRSEGPGDTEGRSEPCVVADASVEDQSGRRVSGLGEGNQPGDGSARQRFAGLRTSGELDDASETRRLGALTNPEGAPRDKARLRVFGARRSNSKLADADGGDAGAERQQRGRKHRQQQEDSLLGVVGGTCPTDGFWRAADWVLCRDPDAPKWRPVRPSSFVLVDEYPDRVGRLRAYGNAIVAELATTFVECVIEHLTEEKVADLV